MTILLKNGHLILPVHLVETVLEGELQINWVYYPERRSLLFAGKSRHFFEKMHKTMWQTLKNKNVVGDKAFFIRGILIDNNLDDTDRELSYEIKTTGIVTVEL